MAWLRKMKNVPIRQWRHGRRRHLSLNCRWHQVYRWLLRWFKRTMRTTFFFVFLPLRGLELCNRILLWCSFHIRVLFYVRVMSLCVVYSTARTVAQFAIVSPLKNVHQYLFLGWSPTFMHFSSGELLALVQNPDTPRFCPYSFIRDISYEMRLSECGLTILYTRSLRGDQIEAI